MPEPIVLIGHQFGTGCQLLQRTGLPAGPIALDQVKASRRQDKEAAVDLAAVTARFLVKPPHLLAVEVQGAITARRSNGSDRSQATMGLVKLALGGDIDIRHPITIGKKEKRLVLYIGGNPLETSTGQGVLAGIDQGHPPRLGLALMDLHAIVGHIEGDIGHVQEVVGEVLLDHVALVATADHDIMHPVRGVGLHDVPQDRTAADLDHGLGPEVDLLGYACTQPSRENNRLHFLGRAPLRIYRYVWRIEDRRPRHKGRIIPPADPSSCFRPSPARKIVIADRILPRSGLYARLRDLFGDRFVAHQVSDSQVLERRKTVKKRLRGRFKHIPKGVSLSKELIADRRADANRDTHERRVR